MTRDGVVNAADTSEVKSIISTLPATVSPMNVTADVKLDGKLNLADFAVVKASLGHTVAP